MPAILTVDEITRLIDAARTLTDRTMLMVLYSTGMRNAELRHLQVQDVDSRSMLIHIQWGTAAERAGLEKRMSAHVLRHKYATHLLEGGRRLAHDPAVARARQTRTHRDLSAPFAKASPHGRQSVGRDGGVNA